MKKKLYNPAMLAMLTLILFVNNCFASYPSPNSAVCLKLNGIILKSPKSERGLYKVELIYDNSMVVDSARVSINKPFEFGLVKNSLYTLRITKEGFVPLFLKVDTKLTPDNNGVYEFRFQTELLDSAVAHTLDPGGLNAPVGVVKYDEVNNRFYPVDAPKETLVEKDLTCLKLNGLILKSPKKTKGLYKVELLQDNNVVDSKTVPVNKPFEFALAKNTWYTVRISKEGFVPLLISIDTELNKDNTTLYEFEFETELFHSSDVNSIDRDSFDLPYGLVRFDESNNRFYPVSDYRAHIPGAF
ncbi:MAG: hypothetical protein H0U95_03640 [Bacteroidetes bacterium]|nr:hypothetical protein [Bacteroidota bacterium]